MAPARALWIHGAMSGFLQLGGNAGAMTVRTPVRALDTPYIASTERPVLIVATVGIGVPNDLEAGAIALNIGAAQVANVSVQYMTVAAGGGSLTGVLVGLAPPGATIEIATNAIDGAPTFTLYIVAEVVL
jgi:hypothetical protein